MWGQTWELKQDIISYPPKLSATGHIEGKDSLPKYLWQRQKLIFSNRKLQILRQQETKANLHNTFIEEIQNIIDISKIYHHIVQ